VVVQPRYDSPAGRVEYCLAVAAGQSGANLQDPGRADSDFPPRLAADLSVDHKQ
jgi:hypothetical protein